MECVSGTGAYIATLEGEGGSSLQRPLPLRTLSPLHTDRSCSSPIGRTPRRHPDSLLTTIPAHRSPHHTTRRSQRLHSVRPARAHCYPPLLLSMPLPTSKKNAGLGHAIANRRAKESLTRNASHFHTTDFNRGLQSVTHQGDLEEFIATAQLAESDFTAERRNVTIVPTLDNRGAKGRAGGTQGRGWNPFLLDGQEEKESLERQKTNRHALRVPRRSVARSPAAVFRD